MNHRPPVTARCWILLRGRRWVGLVVLGCVVLILLWGCSTPEQRYEVLSFFFDGVPDPGTPIDEASPREQARRRVLGVNYFRHEPFDKKNCQACHGIRAAGRIRMISPDASVCLDCHGQVTQQYPVMHGPVAVGACLWCHLPHESNFRHLLRDADNRLCDKCHDRELLLGPVPPAHQDPERGCLECHVGHGSAHRHLLRVQLPLDEGKPESPEPELGLEDST